MKIPMKRGGDNYDAQTAEQFISEGQIVKSLTAEVDVKMKWKDNKPTDEVSGYNYWFGTEGLNPFEVKFDHELEDLPAQFADVSFENLRAIQIRSNVYFKADGIRAVKAGK
ncbi:MULTISPECIES: hypothetical protein [Lactiplantibacillus]|uniref:hypothetical protein n=1 Tax=Lactiplantibacillus TaxID=2767842 RepID=UPI001C1F40A0|nr:MULTISPECIES: hypothetical protein [Lactiplantibacillus]MBU7505004.1 hypothetical protein [Lactiplantibacillus pentosus]MCT4443941.1 hypothetical protein [Lactiplantibacillus argentoratensis]